MDTVTHPGGTEESNKHTAKLRVQDRDVYEFLLIFRGALGEVDTPRVWGNNPRKLSYTITIT